MLQPYGILRYEKRAYTRRGFVAPSKQGLRYQRSICQTCVPPRGCLPSIMTVKTLGSSETGPHCLCKKLIPDRVSSEVNQRGLFVFVVAEGFQSSRCGVCQHQAGSNRFFWFLKLLIVLWSERTGDEVQTRMIIWSFITRPILRERKRELKTKLFYTVCSYSNTESEEIVI